MSAEATPRRSAKWGAVGVIGRDAEIEAISELIARLAEGYGGALLVEGHSGIGKSRLIEVALDLARARNITAAVSAADPLRARQPFDLALAAAAALAEAGTVPEKALDDLLVAASRRTATPAFVPPGSARVQVIDSLVDGLAASIDSPLLLTVENLHWADDVSLEALRAILSLVDELPLCLIASARPASPRGADIAVRREMARVGSTLRLGPLPDTDGLALAAALLGATIGERLASLIRRTGGNPLLITELVRALESGGHLVADAETVELGPDGTDFVLADTLAARIRTVDDEVRSLLRAGAILGESFTVRDVALLVDQAAASLAPALDRCLEEGLLLEQEGSVRFSHELLREAVYEETPASLRAALHFEAARILAAREAPPLAIATHAALSAAPDQAVGWLRTAAADVLSLSPQSALTFLDDALGLEISDGDVRSAIQRARVEALMGVGRLSDAASLAEHLLDSVARADEKAELLIRLAGLFVLLNRTDDAIGQLDRAAAEAESPGLRALALAQCALAMMTKPDLARADHLAREAASLADRSGDAPARTLAGSVLARLPSFSHRYEEGLPIAVGAVQAADSDPSGRAHDYIPWFWVGVIALDLDDYELVDRAVREGRKRADESYATWAQSLYCGLAASLHHRRGDLDDAAAEARAGVAFARDTGSAPARMWCESLLALVACLRGDAAERDAQLEAAEASWVRDNAMLGIDHLALAQASAQSDASACEHLSASWDLFSELQLLNCQPLLAVPLARVAIGRDDPRLHDVTAAMRRAADDTGLPALAALHDHVAGIEHGSIDRLTEAAQSFGALGRRLDQAEARADAARLASRDHDRRTRALVGDALAAFEACGAFGAAEALEREVGSTSATQRADHERVGWESLTPTERAVAALVGEGFTNGQIAARRYVSRRTIESHLLRIYAKLGHSSRTRLAVEASKRFGASPAQ